MPKPAHLTYISRQTTIEVGNLVSPETETFFMTEEITEQRPLSKVEKALLVGRSVPPRAETRVEKPSPLILEDELLGGFFLPPFSSSPEMANFLTWQVLDRKNIRPFLASVIAGRVNNPYLLLADNDRPSCREADYVGIETDPEAVVRKIAARGEEAIERLKSSTDGEHRIQRLFKILKDGQINTIRGNHQRRQDIELLKELDILLGVNRIDLGNINSSGLGKMYRDGTYVLVDKTIRREATDPETPLIDYRVIDEGENSDRRIRIIRTIRLPKTLKNTPRKELLDSLGQRIIKREDLYETLKNLTDAERLGYELMGLASYYLGDPLIRYALEESYRDNKSVKVMSKEKRASHTEEQRRRLLEALGE